MDNLTKIAGLGPKSAQALQAAGITTYAELAAAGEAGVRAALTAAGIRATASVPNWPVQARALADQKNA
ncbi:helix-hairpin-helix domain-containing protein [Catenuloplanes indicus]|uniref:Flap endonuclease-1-like 5' DNA nuclease n=1 Tax=Catenuloplanes indicus TaxID=137267 RepID=A0AAE3VY40_9ACTN|nr:helix-hairpin-helix domain-containing protein [Catenuloplanes indicus]MDQ0365422.1 putative flap endonuclease-1-like 5' DNA nuclease [Catenuloplanes indicus]